MGILPNIFAKKEEEAIKKLKQQINSAKKTKKTASPAKKVIEKKPKKPEVKKTQTVKTPMAQDISVFYGNAIRRLYFDDHWYFFLEDVIAVSGKLGVEKVIKKLKSSSEYQENGDQYIISLKAIIDNQPKDVDCIDDQGFLWLLPLIRSDERVFPGPFPDWIKQTSKLPIPTPPPNKEN